MKIKKLLASAAAATLAVSTLAASAFAATYDFKAEDTTVYNATVAISFNGYLGTGDAAIKVVAPAGVSVDSVSLSMKYYDNKEALQTYTGTWVKKDGWPLINDGTVGFSTFNGPSVNKDIPNLPDAGTDYNGTATLKISSTKKIDKDATSSYGLAAAETEDNAVQVWWAGTQSITLDADTSVAGGYNGMTVDKKLANAVLQGKEDAVLKVSFDDPKATTIVTLSYTAAGADKATDVEAVVKAGATSVEFKIPAKDFFIPAAIVDGVLQTEELISPFTVSGITVKAASLTYGAAADVKPAETTTVADDVKPAETTTVADDKTPTDPSNGDANGDTNNGDKNDDKNSPTGFAIAVVPAVISAAAAIVAKKRK